MAALRGPPHRRHPAQHQCGRQIEHSNASPDKWPPEGTAHSLSEERVSTRLLKEVAAIAIARLGIGNSGVGREAPSENSSMGTRHHGKKSTLSHDDDEQSREFNVSPASQTRVPRASKRSTCVMKTSGRISPVWE